MEWSGVGVERNGAEWSGVQVECKWRASGAQCSGLNVHTMITDDRPCFVCTSSFLAVSLCVKTCGTDKLVSNQYKYNLGQHEEHLLGFYPKILVYNS